VGFLRFRAKRVLPSAFGQSDRQTAQPAPSAPALQLRIPKVLMPRCARASAVLALFGLSTLYPEALAGGLSAAFRSDPHDGTSPA
jgi:hypothetical protein